MSRTPIKMGEKCTSCSPYSNKNHIQQQKSPSCVPCRNIDVKEYAAWHFAEIVHAKDSIDMEIEFIMEHMTEHNNGRGHVKGDPHRLEITLEDAQKHAGFLVDLHGASGASEAA
jgi:hypothetical protein